METFGVDAETAEAAIDSGTTSMTIKQESKLQEFGYDTENFTRKDADYLLDRISKNNWTVPEDIQPAVYMPFAERGKGTADNLPDIPTVNNNNTSTSTGGRSR